MNKRIKVRKYGYAKLLFDSGELGYLRDLAETGFRAEIVNEVDWVKGEKKVIEILPYTESGVPNFSLSVEIRWLRKRKPTHSVGVMITGFPCDKTKQLFYTLLTYYQDTSKS